MLKKSPKYAQTYVDDQLLDEYPAPSDLSTREGTKAPALTRLSAAKPKSTARKLSGMSATAGPALLNGSPAMHAHGQMLTRPPASRRHTPGAAASGGTGNVPGALKGIMELPEHHTEADWTPALHGA